METCVFCKIIKNDLPAWKISETESACAFLDIHQISKYHTLVIPKKHYENIFEIPENELKETISLVKKICDKYKETLGINNIQLLSSNGKEAQQDVFHFHIHIIPRKNGDNNQLNWQTKELLVEEFDEMLKLLK